MTAWYDKATFYHMYPLGMTGSPFANPYPVSDGAADGTNRDVSADSRMDELMLWIPYLESLHISAIYIGPRTAMIPAISGSSTGGWEPTSRSDLSWTAAMSMASASSWTAYSTTPVANFSPSATCRRTVTSPLTPDGTGTSISAGAARSAIPSATNPGTASGSFPA